MKVEEKLALGFFRTDDRSHIVLDQEACRACDPKVCLKICPAGLYSISEETGEVVVECAGCLECGTCLLACPKGAIRWEYPRGGYGVQYRYG